MAGLWRKGGKVRMVETGARNSAVKSTVSSHAQEASGMEPTRVWVGAARLTSSSEAGTGRPGAAGAPAARLRPVPALRVRGSDRRQCSSAWPARARCRVGGTLPGRRPHGRCAWAAEGRLAAAAVRRAAEVAGPGEGVPAKAAVSRARETGPDAARRARLVSHQSSVGVAARHAARASAGMSPTAAQRSGT